VASDSNEKRVVLLGCKHELKFSGNIKYSQKLKDATRMQSLLHMHLPFQFTKLLLYPQTVFLGISVGKSGLEISDALGNVGLKLREKLVEGEVDEAWVQTCTMR